MLAISALTLFLCSQDFKAIGINRSLVRACARLYVHKTWFQHFWPNSLNFYRIKLIFSVFWDAEKNAKRWVCLFPSSMASFSVAGVFTILQYTVSCPGRTLWAHTASRQPARRKIGITLQYIHNIVFITLYS